MCFTTYYIASPEDLQHHGIKGQRWGVRRYQNTDGSLTSAGKSRLKYKDFRAERKKMTNELLKTEYGNKKPTSPQKTAAKMAVTKILVQKYGKQAYKYVKAESIATGAAFVASLSTAAAASIWATMKLEDL